jgi:hypothetical protein
MRHTFCALALCLLPCVPSLAQERHEVELGWGKLADVNFTGDSTYRKTDSVSAVEAAWRPPLGRGWRLEVAAGHGAGLEGSAGRESHELGLTWAQIGIVTPPAVEGRVSWRGFLRAGVTRASDEGHDPEDGRWTTSETVPCAALGARMDVAVSRRLALGAKVVVFKHGNSGDIDIPQLWWLGLSISVVL